MKLVELNEAIHFGNNVLGWTVLVNQAVDTPRVVRPLLVGASNERYLDRLTELIDRGSCALVAGQQGMHLADIRCRQLAFSLDEGKEPIERLLMVVEDGDDVFWMRAARNMGD
jgi:hypothetical protein